MQTVERKRAQAVHSIIVACPGPQLGNLIENEVYHERLLNDKVLRERTRLVAGVIEKISSFVRRLKDAVNAADNEERRRKLDEVERGVNPTEVSTRQTKGIGDGDKEDDVAGEEDSLTGAAKGD